MSLISVKKDLYNYIETPNSSIGREQLPYGRRYRKRKVDDLQIRLKYKNLRGKVWKTP